MRYGASSINWISVLLSALTLFYSQISLWSKVSIPWCRISAGNIVHNIVNSGIQCVCSEQSSYASSQWDTFLQCNDVLHWLGAYLDWFLHVQVLFTYWGQFYYNRLTKPASELWHRKIITTPAYEVDVITYPCPKFNGRSTKPPLKIWHTLVIKSNIRPWV